jgi:hypothetical protein
MRLESPSRHPSRLRNRGKVPNDHLVAYYSNLLQFVDRLANSREVHSSFIDSSREDDLRPQSIAQFGQLGSFLKYNGLDVAPSDLPLNQVLTTFEEHGH